MALKKECEPFQRERSTGMEQIIVVVPSYNPDGKLSEVIRGCVSVGFHRIIVVNDGSRRDTEKYFEEAARYPEVLCLTHEANRGKGAAMKTAFRYIMEHCPDAVGIVTADGDNQHRPEDIRACAEKMLEMKDYVILGVRNFDGPDVPGRSRFGNKMTSFVFRTGVGLKISDTQTGLRAIPAKYLPLFIKTRGDRYEYETNQLLDLKTYDIPYAELPIRTVYIEENATSHFHPVRDSLRIYSQILKFMGSSLLAGAVDFGAFRLFLWILMLTGAKEGFRILLATAVSRLLSSLVNLFCNKKIVFHSKNNWGRVFLRYYCLCIPQLLLSAGFVRLLTGLFGSQNDWLTTLIKLPVDIFLFIISYQIQRRWVFAKNEIHEKNNNGVQNPNNSDGLRTH